MGRKRITYEELDIRRDGTIYYNGEPKKCCFTIGGYLLTNFDRENHLVHRLIAQKYIPNPENKKCVNHINGIKDDNRVENLEWVTSGENNRHAYRTGLSSQKHSRKLTYEEAREIRNKYVPRKYTQRKLADEYNLTQSTISSIINNKRYKEEVDTTNIFLTN